jgi:hypothetical protein
MSVVGPRPHMLKHTKEYSEIIDKYIVRHFAKPGITGWAQTHGFKGETINIQAMEKRVEHDIWYIENWSFFLDIKIIFLTIKDMFNGLSNHIENSRKSNTDEGIVGKKLPLRLVQSYSIANSLNHKKAFKTLRNNLNNSRAHRNLAK